MKHIQIQNVSNRKKQSINNTKIRQSKGNESNSTQESRKKTQGTFKIKQEKLKLNRGTDI